MAETARLARLRAAAPRPVVLAAVLFVAMAASALPALAQEALRGAALVIGNGDYEHLAPLANPPDDADAIEELLADLGFDSVRRTDRDAGDLARDLERFVEDAADADVAILYYAGHGIEAGGENWLVPVDADISALGAASERLVPVSAIIRRLRESVPVTIVLLDACRDNPFPPGAALTPAAGGDPLPVSAGGLTVADTRGATGLAQSPAAAGAGNLGIVVGFAAAPGEVALDGEAGENSPYAAALIRHISAMAGAEFGTVMRMVAEEVYLKTGGAQRPWVNESLRRLLYFGEAPEPPDGPDGEILAERRGLLLTIAALPDVQRAQAENLARSGNVPMSVVYAVMRALDVDPSDDPARIEARLRSELARFAQNRAARDALHDPDPEIARLSELADRAELEGALNAADGFREQAKQRVAAMRDTRREQVEALRRRIVEDAEVYARSAGTKTLLFRHAEAARDYDEARAIVADWDAGRAAAYRREAIEAWMIHAELTGSASSLEAAERAARQALAAGGAMAAAERAALEHVLAGALLLRAGRSGDLALIGEARDMLRQALDAAPGLPPQRRARLWLDIGRATGQLALARADAEMLAEAEGHFARAVEAAGEAGDDAVKAEAEFRAAQAVYYLWSANPDQALFLKLQQRLMSLLGWMEETEIDPLAARYLVRVGEIGLDLAMRQNTPQAFGAAAEINDAAAAMFAPERYPLIRAETRYRSGRIGLEVAERFGDFSRLEAALADHDAALETYRQAGLEDAAADIRWQRALVLAAIGTREAGTRQLDLARRELEALKRERTGLTPPQRRNLDFQLARVGAAAAVRAGDAGELSAAVAELRRLREAVPPADDPQSHTQIGAELGKAVAWLAGMQADVELLTESAAILDAALEQYEEWGARQANAVPFAELYQHYAGVTADLALKTGEAADIETAIAASEDFHAQLVALGDTANAAITANTAAYLHAQALRLSFDEGRLARAEALAAEALREAGAMPELAGYFRNTACEIATEKARARADAGLAAEALADCRAALAALERHGRVDAVPTAQESVARARALVTELGG